MRIVLLCTFIDSISKSITGLPQASCQTFLTLCRNPFNSYNCRYREALWERSVFPKNATKWPGQVLNPRTLRARVQHAKNYATTSTTQGTNTNMEFVFFSTLVCSHHVTNNPRGKRKCDSWCDQTTAAERSLREIKLTWLDLLDLLLSVSLVGTEMLHWTQ